MQGEYEAFFMCPYCGEEISMLLEVYYSNQQYIEDCQVCCSPIQISYQSDGESVTINSISKA